MSIRFYRLLVFVTVASVSVWIHAGEEDAAASGETPGSQTAPAGHPPANEGGAINPFQVVVPADGGMDVGERFARADWVALVHIESIGHLVNPSLSQAPEMMAVQAFNYRASVLHSWKGEQLDTIEFRVDLSDCRKRLEVDDEYLVFGFINRHGKPQSFGCADLIPRSQTSQLLGELDKISADKHLAHNR